jgi:SAM-dependent methyltransferase
VSTPGSERALRLAPMSPELLHRLGRMLGLADGVRVLDVGAGLGTAARHFAREHGASIVAVDADPEATERLSRFTREEGTASLLEVHAAAPSAASFEPESFDALLTESLPAPFGGNAAFLTSFGPLVRRGGGLAFVAPCRIGRTAPAGFEAVEAMLGGPLVSPGNVLLALGPAGYEPIATEAVPEAAVKGWIEAIGPIATPIEAALSGLGFVLVVARRLDENGVSPAFTRRSRE